MSEHRNSRRSQAAASERSRSPEGERPAAARAHRKEEPPTKDKEYYTIGEVGKICNISAKALRYYDKIGVISPDYICEENGYRYYSRKTLLTVPVMKYYKQMGFKLEEMQELLGGNTYYYVQQNFRSKIDELKAQEQEIHDSLVAVKDWYELVREAQMVIRNDIRDISVKFMSQESFCFMDQEFSYEYMDSIINIPWTNYLEEIGQKITGPVILRFPSLEEKMKGNCARARIMQRAVLPDEKNPGQTVVGGGMAVSVYHIGSHETIDQEYERILEWAGKRGYQCGPECYERYVVDYWTTREPAEFVTEVIVPVTKAAEAGNIPL